MKTILLLLLTVSGTAVAQAADYSCVLPSGEFGLAASTNYDLVGDGDSYVVVSNVGEQLSKLELKAEERLRYWQSADRVFTFLQHPGGSGTARLYAGQVYHCEEI